MRVQVFEVMSRQKIVGVLETGGIGEISVKNMSNFAYNQLHTSNLFNPCVGFVSDDIAWDSDKKHFFCSSIYV